MCLETSFIARIKNQGREKFLTFIRVFKGGIFGEKHRLKENISNKDIVPDSATLYRCDWFEGRKIVIASKLAIGRAGTTFLNQVQPARQGVS